jgi:hypothetical protein
MKDLLKPQYSQRKLRVSGKPLQYVKTDRSAASENDYKSALTS